MLHWYAPPTPISGLLNITVFDVDEVIEPFGMVEESIIVSGEWYQQSKIR